MTIGHPNSGYAELVSKYKLALDNPSGNRTQFQRNSDELDDIRQAAKNVWSAKDNFETTYGRYHGPHKYDQQLYRPSSPSRKNNPHPTKVFLTSRMSHIPGHFDDNDFETRSQLKMKHIPIPNYPNMEHKDIMPSSVKRYSNTKEYFKTLNPIEVDSTDNYFKDLGIDTSEPSLSNFNYTTPQSAKASSRNYLNGSEAKSMFDLHNNTTGDSEYRDMYMGKSAADEIDARALKKMPDNELQTNATNPFLYNDYLVYREKYANGDHGVPNPDAKKYWPSRGEFLIHPDWHARLKHHRLPCNC